MIVWTDLETTGLKPTDLGAQPLEIAIIITDDDLELIAEMQQVIRFDISHFDSMQWDMYPAVREMHEANGLFDECLTAPSYDSVRRRVVDFLSEHLNGEKPPLGGSTISFDRAWLGEFFPDALELLHYRNIDVSGIKELVKRWRPDVYAAYFDSVPENKAHRAHDDILETLREINLYREMLFHG